jgi:hypothetical protein
MNKFSKDLIKSLGEAADLAEGRRAAHAFMWSKCLPDAETLGEGGVPPPGARRQRLTSMASRCAPAKSAKLLSPTAEGNGLSPYNLTYLQSPRPAAL